MECHKTPGPASGQRPYVDAHAVGVPIPPGTTVPLPLDRATNAIGCLTCHDPHVPRSSREPVPKPLPGPRPSTQPATLFPSPTADFQFLRRSGSELCVLCHEKLAATLHNAHDPARFTPSMTETLGIPSSAGSCRVCHTVHSAQGPHLWARPPVGDGGPTSGLCQACHNSGAAKKPRETQHPLGFFDFKLQISASGWKESGNDNPQSEIRNPKSKEVSCTSCHDPHGNAPPRDIAESVCIDCHQDKRGVKGSIHDPGANQWARDLGFVSRNLCLDCHPIHSPKNQGGLRKVLAGAKTSDDLCEACHGPAGPGPAVHTPHVSKANADGERIRCTTCHDIHQHKPDSKLLRASRQDSALCLNCHSERRPLLSTLHDLARSAPEARNTRDEPAAQSGSCGGCHLVHPPAAGSGSWAQSLPPGDNPAKGLCTGCHRQGGCAADRVPEYREHPEIALLNRLAPEHPDYMPTFDGQGRPSPTGVISCPTCHQVHATPTTPVAQGEPSPSQHRFLRTGRQTLCADCHGVQALWRFLFFHNANRNPERKQVPMYAP
jgi:predicted CXXCH cytochrome family protein